MDLLSVQDMRTLMAVPILKSTGGEREMNRRISRMTFFGITLGVVLTAVASGIHFNKTIDAASPPNPFHGTYEGGFWAVVTGYGPFGGPVKATVNNDGKVTVTVTGAVAGATVGAIYIRALNSPVNNNLVPVSNATI